MKRMLKQSKKLISIFLTLIMLLITIIVMASAKTATYKTGDVVEFGVYPQSKVTDSSTISKLDKITKNWISYGYRTGTGSWFDDNMEPANYMKYADIDSDDDGKYEYRAVKFTQYRPSGIEWLCQEDNGYYKNTVYYFEYEPLTWRVLDSSTGLIMCDDIIDSQAYQNYIYKNGGEYYNSKDYKNYASDWATSSLRKWLNEDFYNTAFTKNQKSKILTTHNENKSTDLSTYNGADTDDKIFVISYYDAINSKYCFSSDDSAYDVARQLKGTDYAKCQGLWVYNNESKDYNGNSMWWQRSPYKSVGASVVDPSGKVLP